MELLNGLLCLRDELNKIHISGWEDAKRFSMCGDLLDSIISAVQTAQNAPEKEGTEIGGSE